MNIVFWGEEHGCGTTAHMLAVAGMLSVLCPRADIGIGALPGGRRAAFHFYDGGAGLTERRLRMLRAADLVVVNLRPDKACVEHFFGEHRHIAKNKMILLGNYDEDARINCAYLEHFYRAEPEQIGGIPYNNGFYQALLHQRTDAFIRRECDCPGSLRNEQFLNEVRQIAKVILAEKENETNNISKRMKN